VDSFVGYSEIDERYSLQAKLLKGNDSLKNTDLKGVITKVPQAICDREIRNETAGGLMNPWALHHLPVEVLTT
jgi:hypothetical protein